VLRVRACAYERLDALGKAAEDLRSYLRKEKEPSDLKEISQWLAQIEQKLAESASGEGG
jgi:hypothetical protein